MLCAGLMLVLSGCGSLRDCHDSLDSQVRCELDRGNYHEALRLLPAAMAEWEEEIRQAGHSFEDAPGFLYSITMSRVA